MKILFIIMGISLLGCFFIPNSYIKDFVSDKESMRNAINNLLTILTFLSGFILLILPMKVNSSNQKPTVQARLHTYLIKRNRFLTVLFFLFIFEMLLLISLLFSINCWVLKLSFVLFGILVIAIIRLFFIIREYVEYSE